MTAPSRSDVRRIHELAGWALVVDTDDIDIYTCRHFGRYWVQVLDCGGRHEARRYTDLAAGEVVKVVAAHLAREVGP